MYLHVSNCRNILRPALLLLGLCAAAATSAADNLAIEPFPRAEVARERVQTDVEHSVVIGNIRRINNQVRAEREMQAVGELIRLSWRIPEGHSAREAMAHAVAQLQEHP